MLTLATIAVVVLLPMSLLAALLFVVGRRERARDARIARQVAVTDAIHRELGAVVAPVVKRRFTRAWRAEIAVPFESPAIVGRIAAIAHAAMRGTSDRRGIEIVLTAQEPEVRRNNVRTLRPVASPPPVVSEWETVAWTGTNTSRTI